MAAALPSAAKTLNYALVTFLVALPAMVLAWKWGTAG